MPKEKKSLTKKDVIALAQKMNGTTNNVYVEVDRMFGMRMGEEIFDLLKQHADLLKCEECGMWLDKGDFATKPEEQEDGAVFCKVCMDGFEEAAKG